MAQETAVANRPTMDQYLAKIETSVFDQLKGKAGGSVVLPKNYVATNAYQAAILKIQETIDRDKRPALSVCTPESVKQSLLTMLLSGLTVEKKQGYFIVFGNKLVFLTSYFGEVAKAKSVDPSIDDVFGEVVYKGDKFRYKIVHGHKEIVEHEQDPDNIDLKNIIGSYATILYKDGKEVSDYMTIEQIRNSWSRGQTKGQSDAHKLAPEEMCKKTVLRRLCKAIYNTSDDSELVSEADLIDEQIDQEQNQQMIDITPDQAGLPSPEFHGSVDEDGVIEDEPTTKEVEQPIDDALEVFPD